MSFFTKYAPHLAGIAAIAAVAGLAFPTIDLVRDMLGGEDPEPIVIVDEAPDEPIVTMTLEDFEDRQRLLRKQIEEELEQAQGDRRAQLQRELAEVTQRMQASETAYAEAVQRLEDLQSTLDEIGTSVPDDRLTEARDLLAKGETRPADQLFAEIEEAEQDAVERAASAAYARGEIAEDEVRWHDAAEHYSRAARLDPTFQHLFKAREFVWRSGHYALSFRYGEDMVRMARAEGDQRQLAIALNEHGIEL